jgi:hypothetical protein
MVSATAVQGDPSSSFITGIIQIIDSVIDHPPYLFVCPVAALLAVAAPAQTLKIINVSARSALRHGSDVISFKQKIIA